MEDTDQPPETNTLMNMYSETENDLVEDSDQDSTYASPLPLCGLSMLWKRDQNGATSTHHTNDMSPLIPVVGCNQSTFLEPPKQLKNQDPKVQESENVSMMSDDDGQSEILIPLTTTSTTNETSDTTGQQCNSREKGNITDLIMDTNNISDHGKKERPESDFDDDATVDSHTTIGSGSREKLRGMAVGNTNKTITAYGLDCSDAEDISQFESGLEKDVVSEIGKEKSISSDRQLSAEKDGEKMKTHGKEILASQLRSPSQSILRLVNKGPAKEKLTSSQERKGPSHEPTDGSKRASQSSQSSKSSDTVPPKEKENASHRHHSLEMDLMNNLEKNQASAQSLLHKGSFACIGQVNQLLRSLAPMMAQLRSAHRYEHSHVQSRRGTKLNKAEIHVLKLQLSRLLDREKRLAKLNIEHQKLEQRVKELKWSKGSKLPPGKAISQGLDTAGKAMSQGLDTAGKAMSQEPLEIAGKRKVSSEVQSQQKRAKSKDSVPIQALKNTEGKVTYQLPLKNNDKRNIAEMRTNRSNSDDGSNNGTDAASVNPTYDSSPPSLQSVSSDNSVRPVSQTLPTKKQKGRGSLEGRDREMEISKEEKALHLSESNTTEKEQRPLQIRSEKKDKNNQPTQTEQKKMVTFNNDQYKINQIPETQAKDKSIPLIKRAEPQNALVPASEIIRNPSNPITKVISQQQVQGRKFITPPLQNRPMALVGQSGNTEKPNNFIVVKSTDGTLEPFILNQIAQAQMKSQGLDGNSGTPVFMRVNNSIVEPTPRKEVVVHGSPDSSVYGSAIVPPETASNSLANLESSKDFNHMRPIQSEAYHSASNRTLISNNIATGAIVNRGYQLNPRMPNKQPVMPQMMVNPRMPNKQPVMPQMMVNPRMPHKQPVMPQMMVNPRMPNKQPVMPQKIVNPRMPNKQPVMPQTMFHSVAPRSNLLANNPLIAPRQQVTTTMARKTNGEAAPQLPDLVELLRAKVIEPGDKVLSTTTAQGRVFTASLTPEGWIRGEGGETFRTPMAWYKALDPAAHRLVITKKFAYPKIQYKGIPLLRLEIPRTNPVAEADIQCSQVMDTGTMLHRLVYGQAAPAQAPVTKLSLPPVQFSAKDCSFLDLLFNDCKVTIHGDDEWISNKTNLPPGFWDFSSWKDVVIPEDLVNEIDDW